MKNMHSLTMLIPSNCGKFSERSSYKTVVFKIMCFRQIYTGRLEFSVIGSKGLKKEEVLCKATGMEIIVVFLSQGNCED